MAPIHGARMFRTQLRAEKLLARPSPNPTEAPQKRPEKGKVSVRCLYRIHIRVPDLPALLFQRIQRPGC